MGAVPILATELARERVFITPPSADLIWENSNRNGCIREEQYLARRLLLTDQFHIRLINFERDRAHNGVDRNDQAAIIFSAQQNALRSA